MAVICIFKLKNKKYFVLRMDSVNLTKINDYHFEENNHELYDFLPEEVLQNEWIKINPIIGIESISHSKLESDEDLVTEKIIKIHGIENVKGGSYK